jgi:hypothetical protein
MHVKQTRLAGGVAQITQPYPSKEEGDEKDQLSSATRPHELQVDSTFINQDIVVIPLGLHLYLKSK